MRRLILVALLFCCSASAFAVTVVNTQQDWRWRNDDGGEASATWKANKNTAASLVLGNTPQQLRLRFSIKADATSSSVPSGALGSQGIPSNLEYSTNPAGGWTTLPYGVASGPFQISNSTLVADNAATSQQLFSGTAAAGVVVGATHSPQQIDIPNVINHVVYPEYEWILKTTSLTQSGTYYFRIPQLNGYSSVAQLDVVLFGYFGTPYCASTGTVTPVNGLPAGGTYTGDGGLSIDAGTGAVDLAASTSGDHMVSYTYGGGTVVHSSFNIRPQEASPTGFSSAVLPNQSVCAGSATTAVNFNGPVGLTYAWTNSNPAIGLAAAGTNSIPSFVGVGNSGSDASGNVRIRASGGTGCNFKAVSFQYTVRPMPTVNSVANQMICAGQPTNAVTFTGNVPGTTYSWVNTNRAIGLTGSGAGPIPSFIAINRYSFDDVARVTITPSKGGCVGSRVFFYYDIAPTVNSIRYQQPAYCPVGWTYVTRDGASDGLYSAVPAGLVIDESTGAINLALSDAGTYTVTYDIGTSSCSPTQSTQITVLPRATVNAVPNQYVCDGIPTAPINFTGTAAAYRWSSSNATIGMGVSGTGNIPGFTPTNPGQYATITVTPVGDGTTSCTAKPMAFRIAVNNCSVTQVGNANDGDARMAIDRQVVASPNPTSGVVRVQYSGTAAQLDVLVRDAYGTILMPVRRMASNNIQIDLGSLRPGSYAVQFTDPRTGAFIVRTIVKL